VNEFSRRAHLIILVIFAVIIAVPLFLHLEKLPIRIWDEARLAMNAYEMAQNGNLLVTHFDGKPDMWNTKPPLMIWLQAGFIKVLGFNELSLRLPAALAAFFTCLAMTWFSFRYWRNYLPGIIASLVLVTSNGYVHIHASRTGDYDAPLALFTTVFILAIFLFVERGEKKYLHLFFVGVTLAILTKSVQGLIFLPAIAVYIVLTRKLRSLVFNRLFFIDLFISISIVGAYYTLREIYNPGYLKAILENELGGRYLQTLEENGFGKMYYLEQLRYFLFDIWFWFVPGGIILGLSSNLQDRKFVSFTTLLILTYGIIISFSKTKLEWYVVPMFPLLALLVMMFFWRTTDFILARIKINSFRITCCALLYLPVFVYAYYTIGRKVYNPSEYEWDRDLYPISRVLKEARYGNGCVDGYVICYEGYSTQIDCYVRALNDAGHAVRFETVDRLRPNQKVIASEPDVIKTIEDNYDVVVDRTYYNVKFFRVVTAKVNDATKPFELVRSTENDF
jgi:4-amino-4-deoxy-L-arabinose transferase-like glycosyltransferase